MKKVLEGLISPVEDSPRQLEKPCGEDAEASKLEAAVTVEMEAADSRSNPDPIQKLCAEQLNSIQVEAALMANSEEEKKVPAINADEFEERLLSKSVQPKEAETTKLVEATIANDEISSPPPQPEVQTSAPVVQKEEIDLPLEVEQQEAALESFLKKLFLMNY